MDLCLSLRGGGAGLRGVEWPERPAPSARSRVWAGAVRSAWPDAPTWCHGDIAVGNLVTTDGALSAVIDFGGCSVGDPACDLVMAWTYFTAEERAAFREAVGLSADTWRRARGWALWKELVTMPQLSGSSSEGVRSHVLTQVLADPVAD